MTLGIDIGGTTISFGLIRDSRVVSKVTVPSFPKNASLEQTLNYLGDRIQEILIPEVERIGIGVPSVVDPEKGIVYNAANIPSWDVVPLKEFLEGRFHIPVAVNNDANCYALGAAALVKKPAQVLVCVTLGTGTGVGIVHKGQIFAGTHCGAGEIGALPYKDGIYEHYCSKQFFVNQDINPKEAAQEAINGNLAALDLFSEFGEHLGEFLSVVMYAYDPDCIVFGGGVAHSFDLFKDQMWDTLTTLFPYPSSLEGLNIEAMPNSDVALVGAAALE